MVYLYHFLASAIFLVYLLQYLIRKSRLHSIAQLPGPISKSWLVGNIPELVRPKNSGDADFEWTKTYGTAVRIKGTFGRDVLFTSDPKAIQYIFNASAYYFQRTDQERALNSFIMGKGLAGAEGADHARQRKIMNHAFSYSALRVFLPLFHRTVQRTVSKWRDIISQTGNASSVVDISEWLGRTTLDSLGEAAFDYTFNAIDDDKDNVLSNVYRNLFYDAFLNESDLWIVLGSLLGVLPEWITPLIHRLPSKPMQRLRSYRRIAWRVARSLVDRQIQVHGAGKEGGRDVMSIVVRANLSENPEKRLSDDETLSQLATLMFAGHETTAATATWALYELSRHPEYQSKIRAEIKATRARSTELGGEGLSIADLESMKYLQTVVKETLRYHPIAHAISRQAVQDHIIPLSQPQKTRNGEMITNVPVRKGQIIMISLAAYNRLKTVWGEDADLWRPERFLQEVEDNQKLSLGVIANLATFSSGPRSCIGWRFALLEMQAFLIELIENFEFSPPPGNIEIIRGAAGIMSPIVKGSKKGGAEMPLTVTPVN